uniref:Uncharacterized protein LOC100177054 n=1 Tax=Phallusia mammillata TaxID=59560 RepID=A0A6F9DHH3_9ASCI|nr:uncharacterized protein LOC100177054 [Phallusia mammillata]
MKKSLQVQSNEFQAETKTSASRHKASKKLAFKSPLHLPLRRGGREKSSVVSAGDLQSNNSTEKRKWKRLPRPSATNLDQIFNSFKSASERQMTKTTKSVPNTPSTVSVDSCARRPSVTSIESPRAGCSKPNSDSEDARSKTSSKVTTPQPKCTNRFGFRSSAPISPIVSDDGCKSSKKRFHTLPTRSSTKRIPKRIKAIASVPSTPSFESPGSPLPLTTRQTEVALNFEELTKNKVTSLATEKVTRNNTQKTCGQAERPKNTSVRRGRKRTQSTRKSNRDTSVSSASSTSFTNSMSTSTSSSGPRRHRCDLMGPPYKKTHSRTNSLDSPSTSVSSICYSGASPVSSSRNSSTRGHCGAATTPRHRQNKTRKTLTAGKSDVNKTVDIGLTDNCDVSVARYKTGFNSKPRVSSRKSGQCSSSCRRLCDSEPLSPDNICDKNNNSKCKPLSRDDMPISLALREEDNLVVGPIFPTTPIRTRPDGSSDCNILCAGQIRSPAMSSSDDNDFEAIWAKPAEARDSDLKSVDCNESRFLHPEISETVMAPAAFQLPLSSSSVVSQECCQHHFMTFSEDRMDGIGGNSAHTSTCSIASGDFSTGLDTNSVPDLLGEKIKKKCLASPGHNLPSPSSNSAQNWLRNRSFFLRLIETRRKQHKREWESKKGHCSSERFLQFGQRDGVLQEMADELDEAKSIIKLQESEINSLRSETSKIREGAIEEECYRVEAEIYRAKAENESRIFKATIVDLQDRLRAEQNKPRIAVDGPHKSDNESREAEISVTSYQSDESRRQVTPECPQSNQSRASSHCDQGYFSMKRKAAANELDSLAVQLSFGSNEDKSHHETLYPHTNFKAVGCQTEDAQITSVPGNMPIVISSNAVYHSRRSLLQQSAAKLIGAVLPQLLLVSSLAGKSSPDTVEAERLLCQFVIPAWKGMLTGLQ